MRRVPPTKTQLLKIKEELDLARLGHDLLDQKRNILIIELLTLVDQAVDYQERIEKSLAAAFGSLEDAVLHMGKRNILSVTQGINIEAEITLKQRRVMGVSIPVVETDYTEHGPYFSLIGTGFRIDEAMSNFKDTLKTAGRLAELKVSIMRLAREVKKTIRKVNALDKIAIPDLEETHTHISNRLEENERDMLILMKRVKARLEGGRRNGI